jgi:hypothetical protein
MNCRLTVFATRLVEKGRGRRKKLVPQGEAWQAWNADPRQEAAHGRLAGSGSFYWPSPRAAFRAAVVLFRQDAGVEAIRVEGIGSQPVAYLRRADVCRSHRDHPGQRRLIPRF